MTEEDKISKEIQKYKIAKKIAKQKQGNVLKINDFYQISLDQKKLIQSNRATPVARKTSLNVVRPTN